MVRVSKDPEVRREELIDAADRLFEEKGYDNTSVNDIVRAVGVAQGTFYYHFKSKDEIFTAVADKLAATMIELSFDALREDRDDPIKQINNIFIKFAQFQKERARTVEYVHDQANMALHDRIANAALKKLVPLFADIVRHGNELGVFHVTHAIETIELLFSGLGAIGHMHMHENDPKRVERMFVTASEFMDRALGAETGSFNLMEIFG